jgi:hypothetical protein
MGLRKGYTRWYVGLDGNRSHRKLSYPIAVSLNDSRGWEDLNIAVR